MTLSGAFDTFRRMSTPLRVLVVEDSEFDARMLIRLLNRGGYETEHRRVETAEELREDGFFITGDLGKIDPDGYVHIVGRGKDLIISGGFNVYPKEVEEVIDDLDGVLESAVIGVSHPDFGEGVVAIVVPDNSTDLSENEIVSGFSSRLAKFKHPKHVAIVNELPRNTMGKVQKNVLRERYKDQFA